MEKINLMEIMKILDDYNQLCGALSVLKTNNIELPYKEIQEVRN